LIQPHQSATALIWLAILNGAAPVPDNGARYLLDVSRMVWRRWAGLRPTGIDRICLAWHLHYGPVSQAVLFHKRGWHILPMHSSQTLFHLLDNEGPRDQFRRRFVAWAARNLMHMLRPQPGRGRLWLNVGHTGLNLPHLAEWVRSADIKPVLMLHDIIPITHPEHCREGEKARHEVRVKTLLRIAHAVLGNSQDTLDRLNAYAAGIGMVVPQSLPVWPGTPSLTMPVGDRPALSDDFVILGTIEGRKNHMLLLDVWERLVAQHGEAAPRLVIIGRRGWACDDVLARLQAGGFGSRVVETGALSDDDIARLLAGARALLFPSFAEGYGLPLVEALDAGVPVIASNLDVFREIGQGVPELLPPDDVDGWAAAVMAYAAPESPARAAQMARLAKFRAPDWPGHFVQVDGFLETL
jgi:glycosyltransferase involved in cell wall biosynthesis